MAAIRAAGGEAHAIAADVADRDAAHAIAGQAAAAVGPIDVLINNASTLGPVPLRLLLDTDCEDLERALAVNLVGPFRLTKAIAGPMVLRGRRDDRQRHLRRRDRGVRALGRLRRVEGGARAPGAHLGGGAGRHRRPRAQRRPGRDGHAHARRRDPRRRPRRRWPTRRASPRAIVALLQAEPGPAPGARVAIRTRPAGGGGVAMKPGDDLSRRGATTCACWSIDPRRRRTRRCARRAPLPCPTSSPPAICWSSTTRRRCPRRCAATTTPAARSRRAWSPRAATIASAPCCSARATGASARRIARRPPRSPIGARLRFGALAAEIVARVAGVAAPGRAALRGRRRRAVGRALSRGPARPVLVPRARSAAVGGADGLRGAPVGVRDAVGRAAAVVGDPARAAPQGRALGVAHARRRPELDRRPGDRRRAAARRALRHPGGDRARRGRDARPRRPRRRRRHDRRARARRRGARRPAACAPAPARPT